MKPPNRNATHMTLHDLILVKPLVFSTYPYLFDKGNKRKAKWANKSEDCLNRG